MRKMGFLKDEKGNTMLLFSLAFIVFMGVAGLVVDTGVLYKTKSELRKAANAAALSGAQEMFNSDSAISQVVDNVLDKNGESGSLKELLIKPDGQNKVKVTLEKSVPLYFMKIFKMDSVIINADATAGIAPLSIATGAVPLGIDNSIQLEYMKEYQLKVDAGGSVSGNFGIMALSGVGANLYQQDLMYGYKNDIKTGDIIDTQTGNVEGKTRDGVNYRISSSPYTTNDISNRDDPRIILVLVYEPYEVDINQLKSVRICGFAYFYLEKPMGPQDSSITGYFIQRVGAGTGNINERDNGAYAIRLME